MTTIISRWLTFLSRVPTAPANLLKDDVAVHSSTFGIDMDDGDVTDEEDWQSIGAEALRARSLPPGSLPNSGHMYGSGRIYQPISTYSTVPYSTVPRHQSRTPAQLAQSVPSRTIPIQRSEFNFASGVNDSQERAAIEALMSLGSR